MVLRVLRYKKFCQMAEPFAWLNLLSSSIVLALAVYFSSQSYSAPRQEDDSMKSSQTPKDLLDVLVIGGGLSGLVVSRGLQGRSAAANINWKLLEARSVLGGRLANENVLDKIDMGGAWIWPHHQPHIRQLTSELNIRTFPQPDDPSSTRIDGGAVRLIREIANTLPDESIRLNSPVTHCKLEESKNDASGEATIRVETANQETFFARRVVFAVPPRLIWEHVTFDPPLSQSKQSALASSHTWMAGVTKVALVYSNNFWDTQSSNMGLPAGAEGPAFQVYDSSAADGSVHALTFFTLVPPKTPAYSDDAILARQVADQMANVWTYLRRPQFSQQAHSYSSFHVFRWPIQKFVSEDSQPSQIHPHPMPIKALSEPEWNGRLLFAGSETDLNSPGVMEGAVSAAKRVLEVLKRWI